MKQKITKNKKKKQKQTAVFALIAVLAAAASVSVGFGVFSAKSKDKIILDLTATLDQADHVEVKAEQVHYFIDENQYHIDMQELEDEINEIISETKAVTGGEWAVYVSVPSSGSTLSINSKKMQAASVIKLFIMAAVYDEYDDIAKRYPDDDIDELIDSMITVSDNESADILVRMLGNGNNAKGRKKVTDFCKANGLNNTTMDRMMQEDNDVSDNYTTTEDTGKFLEMLLDGEFKHSKEMLRTLENQSRVSKIPAGIPLNVTIANKTGELDDVQNDAAIVFAKRPYIICIMTDGISGYQEPIDAIVDISHKTYNYLIPKM